MADNVQVRRTPLILAQQVSHRLSRWVLGLVVFLTMIMAAPPNVGAAPYAAMVIDARTGEVLHSRNADTRLHPASLTKMMTLYIAFEAVRNGEITLDTKVKISRNAAAEPPSKLGLKAGQRIAFRYLIRAAAIKSANDAATAIGMSRTTFKNAHGLTENGHMSTARDMTTLGRHILYDYPEYYNLFSRKSADAGVRTVPNTNRRLLAAYRGADGIKTGYTRAAGFNLVASAQRGNERVIATVFGGKSSTSRNAKVAELLDLGFRRAPSHAKLRRPAQPPYQGNRGLGTQVANADSTAGKTVRVSGLVKTSLRPKQRPVSETQEPATLLAEADTEVDAEAIAQQVAEAQAAEVLATDVLAAEAAPQLDRDVLRASITAAIEEAEIVSAVAAQPTTPIAQTLARPRPFTGLRPQARPARLAESQDAADPEPVIVTRLSTSGGRYWGINVGRYGSRYQAEKVLLRTALAEMATLDGSLRKVVKTPRGFDANFLGMTKESAALACRRLTARNISCETVGPS
jgi:D-alanyl-D-alanine carboxypeptidase